MGKGSLVVAIIVLIFIVSALWYVLSPRIADMNLESETSIEENSVSIKGAEPEGSVDIPSINVGTYTNVWPDEAKTIIMRNSELKIIDVSPKYALGHIPGAISLELKNKTLEEALPGLSKSEIYLVYSHVDYTSVQAAQKFVEAGFSNVYRLKGGYGGWLEFGYSIEKPLR